MPIDELGLVERLLDYAVRFRAANGEHTSGTLLADEAAAQIGRLGAHVTTLLRTAQEDLVLMQETAATVTSLRERAEAAEAQLVAKAAAIERLLAERDQWQQLATEDVNALQAIGEEFGILGGENRVSGARRILTEQRSHIDKLSEALVPFAGAADELPDHIHDMVPVVLTTDEDDNPATAVHIADFRRARQALEATP